MAIRGRRIAMLGAGSRCDDPIDWGHSLVLTAHVKRADIAFYSEEGGEFEAVIFDIDRVEVDGSEHNWWQGFAEYEASKNARNRAQIYGLPKAA